MSGLDLRAWELACYCVVFVVGVIGNSLVCLVVLKSTNSSQRLRIVPFNVYLVALAVADLALAVVCLPVYILSTAAFPHPTGTHGTIFCKFITGYLLPFWFGTVSIYLLVIISFERHNAISNPFLAVTQTASKKTALSIACAWFIGLLVQLPTIIGVKYRPTTELYCDYSWSTTTGNLVYACTFVLQFVVPAVIFIINFYRIRKCLRQIDRTLKPHFLTNQSHFATILAQKKRTVWIVFIASLAFFICWTPNSVMYFLFHLASGNVTKSWEADMYHASRTLAFFNSCVNPFLYAFQSREFRGHCKKVFRQMFGIANRPQTSRTTSTSSSSKTKSISSKSNIRFKQLVEHSKDELCRRV